MRATARVTVRVTTERARTEMRVTKATARVTARATDIEIVLSSVFATTAIYLSFFSNDYDKVLLTCMDYFADDVYRVDHRRLVH
jgi:hypothetical protein